MRIHLTSTQPAARIARHYSGASKPLSKKFGGSNPQILDAWRSEPRNEDSISERKLAAVSFYVWLGQHSCTPLPEGSFPAVFYFDDQCARYPDKGTVKTLLLHGMIEGHLVENELVFSLTSKGREAY
jgi:hypothetical protein